MAASEERYPIIQFFTPSEHALYQTLTRDPDVKIAIKGPLLHSLAHRFFISLGYKLPAFDLVPDWFVECRSNEPHNTVIQLCRSLGYELESPNKLVKFDTLGLAMPSIYIFDSYPLGTYNIFLTDGHLHLPRGIKQYVSDFRQQFITFNIKSFAVKDGEERLGEFVRDVVINFRRAGWQIQGICRLDIRFVLPADEYVHPDLSCRCHREPCPPFCEIFANIKARATSSALHNKALSILCSDPFFFRIQTDRSTITQCLKAFQTGIEGTGEFEAIRAYSESVKRIFKLRTVLSQLPEYQNVDFES